MSNPAAAGGPLAPVTVLGLGPMGAALAHAFVDKGHPTTVWNRSAHKADDLVAKGALRAETAADALKAGSLVVVCVSDYEAMRQILEPAKAELSGKTLVNVTSGTPDEAHAAVSWAAEHGAEYLDGAVMVPPAAVGAPEAVFFYSGSRAPFDAHVDTLRTMGGDAKYLGADPGLAVLYNTALLGFMWSTVNGYLHAAALVATAGATAEEFTPVALDWFLPSVVTPITRTAPAELDSGTYPGDNGTVRMNLTAADHLLQTSVRQGLSDAVPAFLKGLLNRTVAEGRGDESYFAIAEVLKKP
ncbi:NAD(P)-dependent oxidoreductase [Streptomyces sp. NPDC056061]|uniref:NAD(P)-dependent oxidoreductase n=1 Tax=Streptomyces sp. NPDC056061 TaxID=3345700 RepID=UPI0035E00CDB